MFPSGQGYVETKFHKNKDNECINIVIFDGNLNPDQSLPLGNYKKIILNNMKSSLKLLKYFCKPMHDI